ncbi:hypothetical protein [Bacillus atrophaeus]|uniref:hypothetical protein n=1 Tax=Bacillus atrophaeus TaxID=1452 RepID=UPI001F0A0A24|nr:hypothetical protein [Bacillus atrophaeus]
MRDKGIAPLALTTLYHVHEHMKKYFKQYSTLDMTTLLIIIAGIVAIDFENAGTLGKITGIILYLAVIVTLLKGFIMIWREKSHERKRKN